MKDFDELNEELKEILEDFCKRNNVNISFGCGCCGTGFDDKTTGKNIPSGPSGLSTQYS